MEFSIAHKVGMNQLGERLHPDGLVPWDDARPPDLSKNDDNLLTGRLRSCAYCGSMHPADVAAAIKAGARAELADMKYGWPHKFYMHDVPNPHAGLLECRAMGNFEKEGWVKRGDSWYEPGAPAAAVTWGKFYTVHLMDATPEDKAVIEAHLGLAFTFTDDGKVGWRRIFISQK